MCSTSSQSKFPSLPVELRSDQRVDASALHRVGVVRLPYRGHLGEFVQPSHDGYFGRHRPRARLKANEVLLAIPPPPSDVDHPTDARLRLLRRKMIQHRPDQDRDRCPPPLKLLIHRHLDSQPPSGRTGATPALEDLRSGTSRRTTCRPSQAGKFLAPARVEECRSLRQIAGFVQSLAGAAR